LCDLYRTMYQRVGRAQLVQIRAAQLPGRGSIPGRKKYILFFSTQNSDHIWSPHSILFCGNRGLLPSGVKQGEREVYLHLVPRFICNQHCCLIRHCKNVTVFYKSNIDLTTVLIPVRFYLLYNQRS
jgi:hypothetical protein